jgi:hypothetical protein
LPAQFNCNVIVKKKLQLFLLGFFFIFSLWGNEVYVKIGDKIDRYLLVHRHIPSLTQADPLSPFTVGNGEFAFTTDVTGLQTFPEFYKKGIPLGTQSQWGWHSIPGSSNFSLEQTFEYYNTYGRQVPYASNQSSRAGQWLRSNPHRLHLGRIGFKIVKSDGSMIQLSDVTNISQSADIWEGIIKSSFGIEGDSINVETSCHPDVDQIAVRIRSELLNKVRIGIVFDFPYGSLSWGKESEDLQSWNSSGKHTSLITSRGKQSVIVKRTLDSTIYFVAIQWEGKAEFKEVKKHSFLLDISSGDEFNFVCNFSKEKNDNKLSGVNATFKASKTYWKDFWETGGAVDLSEGKDPRAIELERRIILSRYLTAIQCAGSMPPQETGLTFNSWYGKFHLEMHWWHAAHFILWGHPELLGKSLPWYQTIFSKAKEKAERQGYEGVRWPKMVGYDGRESPSAIGVFLIWQQPHLIYFAELLYRYYNDESFLEKYKDIVFVTADFMASYAHWDERNNRYVLGPPLIPAQEIYKPDSTINPAFELSYWLFGLKTAQKWRERLGLSHVMKWDDVINNLSKLPENKGFYQNVENALNTFEDEINRNDHPTVLGAFGMLPNDSIDIDVMRNTLDKVMESWDWPTTWGWDYPLIAMTAARVGKPATAIDALLLDVQKNTYLNNGHNYQDERLPVYLPGNGSLLIAVAMMAAGWDGAPDIHAPGFPRNGKWVVKYEGISPLP